jgi:hypothetical protein
VNEKSRKPAADTFFICQKLNYAEIRKKLHKLLETHTALSDAYIRAVPRISCNPVKSFFIEI